MVLYPGDQNSRITKTRRVMRHVEQSEPFKYQTKELAEFNGRYEGQGSFARTAITDNRRGSDNGKRADVSASG